MAPLKSKLFQIIVKSLPRDLRKQTASTLLLLQIIQIIIIITAASRRRKTTNITRKLLVNCTSKQKEGAKDALDNQLRCDWQHKKTMKECLKKVGVRRKEKLGI